MLIIINANFKFVTEHQMLELLQRKVSGQLARAVSRLGMALAGVA